MVDSRSGLPIRKFAFLTCGDWDVGKMLPMQCNREGVPIPEYFKNGWVNIKTVFGSHYKRKKVQGMAGMLNVLNMDLLGHHHSGIDDCRYTLPACSLTLLTHTVVGI